MKNKFLFIFILFVIIVLGTFYLVNISSYQIKTDTETLEFSKTSKVNISQLSRQQIENLDVLGKVWGMMKYYHPIIIKGEYNWDFELFRIMPEVLNANNHEERNKILVKWIKRFGKLPQVMPIPKQDTVNIKMYPDFEWIKNEALLGKKLSNFLKKLQSVQTNSGNYYVSLLPDVENPSFQCENPYTEMHYPDVGYRLLALYRYWNIVQYYFPYKYLIGEDWNKVLAEFIPQFVDAKNEIEYQLAILKLITRINDSHAGIYQNKTRDLCRGKYLALVSVSFVDGKAIIRKTFEKDSGKDACLQEGDILIKIDAKTIEEKIKELSPISPASNEFSKLKYMIAYLMYSEDSILNVELERDGVRSVKNVRCYILDTALKKRIISQEPSSKMLKNNIGYFYIGSLYRDSIAPLMKRFRHTKGIVIDLRSYPTDDVLYQLGEHFMPKPTPFAKLTKGSITQAGKFSYKCTLDIGKENFNYYKGKIAILVNETTQSAAEFYAMGFRVAPCASVIGSNTAGADGNVSFIMLPGGIRTTISGIGVYYPDGGETQRVGIVPDIEVKSTIKGIREGQDEVLERAIKWINEK